MKSGRLGGALRTLWRLAATAFVLRWISNLTLHSAKVYTAAAPFLCLLGCNQQEIRDLVSNILLFIPLGWVLRYWVSPRVALALCILATIGIESTQAFILIGRDPSLRDILTNTAGGALGIWLFPRWDSIRFADAALSRRVGALFATGWLIVMLVTGFGVHLAGSSNPWFGFWGNHIDAYAHFDGTLTHVDLNGWTPPAAEIPRENPLAEALHRDSVDVQVTAINGSVTRRTALIFAVMDEFDNEMIFVGGAQNNVQFQARTRFDAFGLRGLSLRLPLQRRASAPGDTLEFSGQLRSDAWRLTLRSGGIVDSITLPLTLGIGWATLLPAPLSISYEWRIVNAIWLAVLIAPAGYWFHRANRRRGVLYAAAGAAGVLFLLPPLLSLSPSLWPDWIGTAIGLIFGALLAHRSLHRHPVP